MTRGYLLHAVEAKYLQKSMVHSDFSQ